MIKISIRNKNKEIAMPIVLLVELHIKIVSIHLRRIFGRNEDPIEEKRFHTTVCTRTDL